MFIGNSYTSTHDLPGMVARLARSRGRNVFVESLAGGGMALHQHLAAQGTALALRSRSWSHVVLQEQSILPALPGEREGWMFPAVRRLAAMARAQGAEPVLYLTWARRDVLAEFGFRDLPHLQAALAEGYLAIGDEIGAAVAPVGPAWLAAAARGFDCWLAEGSHPTVTGTYLAACVLYATLFREDPSGLPALPGIGLDEAGGLQAVAASVAAL